MESDAFLSRTASGPVSTYPTPSFPRIVGLQSHLHPGVGNSPTRLAMRAMILITCQWWDQATIGAQCFLGLSLNQSHSGYSRFKTCMPELDRTTRSISAALSEVVLLILTWGGALVGHKCDRQHRRADHGRHSYRQGQVHENPSDSNDNLTLNTQLGYTRSRGTASDLQ